MTPTFDQDLQDRLTRYAAIDSQSDETSPTAPSTAIQFDMSNLLVEELKGIGAQDVTHTLGSTTLNCTTLYYTKYHYTILYYTTIQHTVLYHTVIHHSALH